MAKSADDILAGHGVDSEVALKHYGTKGMKWGRRKKTSTSDDSDADSGPKKPDVKKMTDDELRSAINRIKMEKEFAKLTAPEVNRGRKIVADLLLDVGKQQAKSYLNRQVEDLMKEGLKSAAKKTAKVGGQLALEAAISKATPASARPTVQFSRRPGF